MGRSLGTCRTLRRRRCERRRLDRRDRVLRRMPRLPLGLDLTRRRDIPLRSAALSQVRQVAPHSLRAARRGNRRWQIPWRAPTRCRVQRRKSGKQAQPCDQTSAFEPTGVILSRRPRQQLFDVGLKVLSELLMLDQPVEVKEYPRVVIPNPLMQNLVQPALTQLLRARMLVHEQRKLRSKADVGKCDMVPYQGLALR